MSRSIPNAPSSFADWYALHGIPLGIGRENARVIYEAAVSEHRQAVIDAMSLYNETMDRIYKTFELLYDKWLSAGHRCDMNEAMELLAREIGRPICPDCKCELVKPGNTCSRCDRPPEHSETPIRCVHCNLPFHRHAPALHSGPSRRSCPDGYGWHDHNVFSWIPGA